VADPREVTIVWLLGLQVEMFEEKGHMIPVLHQKDIGLIGNDQLQRRHKVKITLPISVRCGKETKPKSHIKGAVSGERSHYPGAPTSMRRPKGEAMMMSEW